MFNQSEEIDENQWKLLLLFSCRKTVFAFFRSFVAQDNIKILIIMWLVVGRKLLYIAFYYFYSKGSGKMENTWK